MVYVARIQLVDVDWKGGNGHREYQKRGLESRLGDRQRLVNYRPGACDKEEQLDFGKSGSYI